MWRFTVASRGVKGFVFVLNCLLILLCRRSQCLKRCLLAPFRCRLHLRIVSLSAPWPSGMRACAAGHERCVST